MPAALCMFSGGCAHNAKNVIVYTHEFRSELPPVEAGYHGNIVLPPKIAEDLMQEGHRRVVYEVNGVVTKEGAINSDGAGSLYLYLNKSDRSTLRRFGDRYLVVKIGPDQSKYGMSIPVELEEAMTLFPDARLLFDKLSPGRQRSILWLVARPKTEGTRIKKAILAMEYLLDCRGEMDVREMAAWMRGK